MITFTSGQELQFCDADTIVKDLPLTRRYYLGPYTIGSDLIWYLRVTSRGVRTIHGGSASAYAAVTSRLPLTTTLYYCARVRCKS